MPGGSGDRSGPTFDHNLDFSGLAQFGIPVAGHSNRLRTVAACVLNRCDGEWSSTAGGDPYNNIVLPGFYWLWPARRVLPESSLASTAAPQSLYATSNDELHVLGLVLKVGGHSAASSAAIRPLVPVPT